MIQVPGMMIFVQVDILYVSSTESLEQDAATLEFDGLTSHLTLKDQVKAGHV